MYKSGNIVKLKSGGPFMTVDKVHNNKVYCVWFKDDRLKTSVFKKDTLLLVEGELDAQTRGTKKKSLKKEEKEIKATIIEDKKDI